MERRIGATELRQKLTDILQAVREERTTYIIETFDRSQAALINLEEYQEFQRFEQEREAFYAWLETAAGRSTDQSQSLSSEEVLDIIEQVREEIASGALAADQPIDVAELIAHLVGAANQHRLGKPTTLAFQRILKRATDLGAADLAEQHDHYVYGVEKE
jgi:PHD/YefM family antitoxin component YafN of YafNO toxin-antitoxin module